MIVSLRFVGILQFTNGVLGWSWETRILLLVLILLRYVTSSKLLYLSGLFFFEIMGIGYMTCEDDGKYVSNAKLKQLICDRIFLGGKKYFLPTKILTYFEFHRNNI